MRRHSYGVSASRQPFFLYLIYIVREYRATDGSLYIDDKALTPHFLPRHTHHTRKDKPQTLCSYMRVVSSMSVLYSSVCLGSSSFDERAFNAQRNTNYYYSLLRAWFCGLYEGWAPPHLHPITHHLYLQPSRVFFPLQHTQLRRIMFGAFVSISPAADRRNTKHVVKDTKPICICAWNIPSFGFCEAVFFSVG